MATPRPRSNASSRGVIGASRRRGRQVLVSAEIALAAVLLGGAGLLLRSYQHVQAVDPGFDASRTTTFSLSLPNATYADATGRSEFTSQLLERLQSTPGVESASAAMGMSTYSSRSATSGSTRDARSAGRSAASNTAGSTSAKTMT